MRWGGIRGGTLEKPGRATDRRAKTERKKFNVPCNTLIVPVDENRSKQRHRRRHLSDGILWIRRLHVDTRLGGARRDGQLAQSMRQCWTVNSNKPAAQSSRRRKVDKAVEAEAGCPGRSRKARAAPTVRKTKKTGRCGGGEARRRRWRWRE